MVTQFQGSQWNKRKVVGKVAPFDYEVRQRTSNSNGHAEGLSGILRI